MVLGIHDRITSYNVCYTKLLRTDASSLSSTTYATGATVCSATFTASSSGRAFVHLYGRLGSDGTNRTYLSFAINDNSIKPDIVAPGGSISAVVV